MGILSDEQMAQIAAEDEAQGSQPAPATTAPAPAAGAPGKAVYEEEEAPPPEPDAAPVVPPARPSFKAKIYGQEEEVQVLLEDGSINPEIPKRYQQAGAFYRLAERNAELEKELQALRGGQPAGEGGQPAAPAAPTAPAAAIARKENEQLKNINEMLKQLPDDDPYTKVLLSMRDVIVANQEEREQEAEAKRVDEITRVATELRKEEASIRDKYQAGDRAMNYIKRLTYSLWEAGETNTSMSQVAEEFFGYVAEIKGQGINEWKDRHRVNRGAPAGGAASGGTPPAAGPKTGSLSIEKGEVRRAALAHLEAIGG